MKTKRREILMPRADMNAPSAPTITASALSTTEISVALTALATDPSGIASYRLEYKRTVDSTWSLDSATLVAGSFPRTIGGLQSSTSYDTRCRATDSAGNVGAFSATSSATTQSSGSAPVWSSVPTVTFVQGTAAVFDVSSLVLNESSILKNATALPAGVVYNPALKRYEYDGLGAIGGTNGHVLTADDLTNDWAARSTAAGVLVAHRLDTQAIIDDWKFSEPSDPQNAIRMTLDTALKPVGGAGSLKFIVLNSDTTYRGQFSVPLPTFGQGATRWFSYRVYCRADEVFVSPGPKFSILSRDGNGASPTGSHTNNEMVVDLMPGGTAGSGEWNGYNETGGSTPTVEVGFSSQVNGSDFRAQPSRDRGANFFTGTNPDTGAAWSAWEQERARYAVTYGARSSPGAPNYTPGYGDPFSGGVRPYPGEWMTITCRVIIGTYGVANTRWTCWAAREGQPYVQLWDKTTVQLGTDADYNGLNLLPYVTDGAAGGRQVGSRTNNITGATILTVGSSTPLGAGTLEYNATTRRFRWLGSGQSFGTARGFSLVNGITTINVIAAPSTSFVVVEVQPHLLPTSGTVTDSVTIANGRPDSQRNYAEVIFSTQAINAPGGFAPS